MLLFWSLLVSTFVSEDLTCISVGILASHGKISLKIALVAVMVGIFIGDVILFLIGRFVLRSFLDKPPLRWLVSKESIEDKLDWFNARGVWLIFISRFAPGTRLPVYLAAGLSKTSVFRFLPVFLLAVLLWTPFLILLSYYLGDQFKHVFEAYMDHSLWIVMASVFILFLITKLIVPLFSFKGRTLLRSRWYRLIKWEFWSPWFFNIPVVLDYLYVCIRYRYPFTLFTLTNPGFFMGGFIEESKTEIFSKIQQHGAAHIPSFISLSPEWDVDQKLLAVLDWMTLESLSYPIVLKPDVGQRGTGVYIIYDEAHLQSVLPTLSFFYLAQAYVEGPEYGLFYIRHPDSKSGHLVSITEKKQVSVVADGVNTLEDLILTHPRAIYMAAFFLKKHDKTLHHIYPAGETILLGDLGNHCKGAVFLDGDWIKTPELEAALDHLSRSIDGFYYGRYDVKATSLEALQKGQFSIIELNGVASEPTHIYDPKHSVFYAYRTLKAYWRKALRIGHYHYKKGQPVMPLLDVFKILLNAWLRR